MVEELQGKIWTKAIQKSELQEYRLNFQVISQQLVERVTHIIVYATEQPTGFCPAQPTLEHVYFKNLQIA